jgi:hypothetical protein
MSLGPITIFDKSALEALNPDEACWFSHFYTTNITPLFFVETLADLRKELRGDRTPEQVVGNIAYKTPATEYVNVHHRELCIANLLGEKIEMRGVAIVAGGRPVTTGDKSGLMYEQPPEVDAFQRWQDGEFLQVEHQFAKSWRDALGAADLMGSSQWAKTLIGGWPKPRTLAEAKALADRLAGGERHRFGCLRALCVQLAVPVHKWHQVIRRWKDVGGPPLSDFAPFAAHVFTVDLFFCLAVNGNLISPDRPSNKVDVAYLYYLPFCMVFISGDHLHEKTAPLFLGADQEFITSRDLKADLARLDEHFSQLPMEIREQGIMRFASDPPLEGEFLTTKLWDRFLPRWRENLKKPIELSQEKEAQLVERIVKIADTAQGRDPHRPIVATEPDYVVFSTKVPARMGKWRILPLNATRQR